MAYTVYVDDNFHYMDESKRYKLGEYEKAEDAVKAAQRIVDEFLVSNYQIGMTADDLYLNYLSFGKEPFIVPASEEPPFSAWDYAKRQSVRICGGFFLDVFLPLQKNDGFSFEEETYRYLIVKDKTI
jgi:hypothetical protein